ncbi:hypothetical protein C8J57DRAFT_1099143 [Mycena rebaudengoi]|nr:hypothetical protein C8J57DRAFT_1099143 [Mycena rebaudengoi]
MHSQLLQNVYYQSLSNGTKISNFTPPAAVLVDCYACVNPITQTRVISEESLYMELLAADHSGKEPDAGAQEGSGDDYEL